MFLFFPAKEDSKSPVRGGGGGGGLDGRVSVTAPPSRKASAVSTVSLGSVRVKLLLFFVNFLKVFRRRRRRLMWLGVTFPCLPKARENGYFSESSGGGFPAISQKKSKNQNIPYPVA